jgi:transcriptional regulator with XRE-family HTH domain
MTDSEPCPHCQGTGKIKFSVLRALRLRAGLQGKDVAAKIGCTQSNYSRMERGEISPLYRAGALAQLYGVSTDVIFGNGPLPPAKQARPVKAPPAARLKASAARRDQVRAKNRKRRP